MGLITKIKPQRVHDAKRVASPCRLVGEDAGTTSARTIPITPSHCSPNRRELCLGNRIITHGEYI